jgi:TolB-like protein/DNA-binding winged helix-turn-helix (wHTH) protein/Tfp pilus assembly protein PilF
MTSHAASTIDLAATPDFLVGEACVRPSTREIEARGQRVAIEPRVMQVLVLLAERRGETVSRDDMIARCWDGVVVGEDAIQRCIGRLRKVAEITGGFEIETLSRIGYRLQELPAPGAGARGDAGARGARPSIVVLDFKLFTPSDRDSLFAEALAEDVSGALSLNRDLLVIARSVGASLPCCRARDARRIEQELGVRYFAEGTLRRYDGGLRVTVQLTETKSGRILWTHKADVADASLGAPSDDLVVDLAGRISAVIMRNETDRAWRKPSDLTAWEAVVRATAAYQRIDLQNLPQAIAEARKAIAIDPNYGAAHATLANALAATYEVGGGMEEELARASWEHVERALALDPEDPSVLACAANALSMLKRADEALPIILRAVELAPTHAFAHLYLARIYLRLRRAEDALAALAEHERLAPQCPWHYFVAFNKALGHFMAGRLDQAERELERSIVTNPNYPYSWLSKSILCMLQGRPEEASKAAARLQRLEGADSLPLQLARIAHSYPDQAAREMLQGLVGAAWRGAQTGAD